MSQVSPKSYGSRTNFDSTFTRQVKKQNESENQGLEPGFISNHAKLFSITTKTDAANKLKEIKQQNTNDQKIPNDELNKKILDQKKFFNRALFTGVISFIAAIGCVAAIPFAGSGLLLLAGLLFVVTFCAVALSEIHSKKYHALIIKKYEQDIYDEQAKKVKEFIATSDNEIPEYKILNPDYIERIIKICIYEHMGKMNFLRIFSPEITKEEIIKKVNTENPMARGNLSFGKSHQLTISNGAKENLLKILEDNNNKDKLFDGIKMCLKDKVNDMRIMYMGKERFSDIKSW